MCKPLYNSRRLAWKSALLLMFALQIMAPASSEARTALVALTAGYAEQGHDPARPSDSPATTDPGKKPSPGSDASSGQNNGTQGQKAEDRTQQHREPEKSPVWLELVKIVISWPALFALLVLYFVFSRLAPLKLARILRPFRSLKL